MSQSHRGGLPWRLRHCSFVSAMFTCDTNCCFFPPCQEHVPPPTTLPVLSAGWLLLTPLSSWFFPDCFGVWCSVFGCLQRVGPGSLRVSKPSVLGTVLAGGSPHPASPAPGRCFPVTAVGRVPALSMPRELCGAFVEGCRPPGFEVPQALPPGRALRV